METFIKKENIDYDPLDEEEIDMPSETEGISSDEKDPLAFEDGCKLKAVKKEVAEFSCSDSVENRLPDTVGQAEEVVVKQEKEEEQQEDEDFALDDSGVEHKEDGKEKTCETVHESRVSSDFVSEPSRHRNQITEGGREEIDNRNLSNQLEVDRDGVDNTDSVRELASLSASSQFRSTSDCDRRSESSDAKKKFKCGYCPKVFNHLSLFKIHERVHTNEKPFSCNVCNKSFAQSNNLQTHMRTHTQEKPFTCEICYESFRAQSTLKAHLAVHKRGNPFSCEVCERSFAHSTALEAHLLTHCDNSFPCEFCNKSFSQKSILKSHLRTHSDTKPFSCEVCQKSFSTRGILKTHVLHRHISENRFSCEVCRSSFRLKRDFYKHVCTKTQENDFSSVNS